MSSTCENISSLELVSSTHRTVQGSFLHVIPHSYDSLSILLEGRTNSQAPTEWFIHIPNPFLHPEMATPTPQPERARALRIPQYR